MVPKQLLNGIFFRSHSDLTQLYTKATRKEKLQLHGETMRRGTSSRKM